MNELVREFEGDVMVDGSEFFAPVASDLVDGLIGRYRVERAKIDNFLKLYEQNNLSGTISYFFRQREDRDPCFVLDKALCALNCDFWSQALALTDVYEAMPQKRRDKWNEQMRAWQERGYKRGKNPELDLPDFTEEVVRSTLTELLGARAIFFAERVDGIFRSLSREHVTNCPEGFSKRMIMYALDSFGSSNTSQCGHLSDLRNVIAKFMGREAVGWNSSSAIVKAGLRKRGEWVAIDGGALRIRVYLKGTAHLEVHPDMAWRLNGVLASLYPNAIPSSFREKPKKKLKDFVLMDHILPQAVRDALTGMRQASRRLEPSWPEKYAKVPNALEFERYISDKAPRSAAVAVLEAIGGSLEKGGYIQFDYDATEIIDEIVCSGCIPDHKSHQFYPTPEKLARIAVELAEIQEGHNCLEPSAGIGGLADLMPADTLCIEVSPLHCKVLEAKGKQVVEGDFLKYAERTISPIFDRVVMNPPFSEGRWKAHTETAAAKAVAPGGTLVAILPASAKGSLELPGFDLEWSRTYDNEFAGTSISVVILKARRAV
jgi:hypothetical protein